MGTFTTPICLSQPPTQKGQTLDSHLSQDSLSGVPTPSHETLPAPPQHRAQGSQAACKGQPSGLGSVGGPGPGLAVGLQSAGLGRRWLEPSRKFEYALTAELALPTDPVSAQIQPQELTDHHQ